VGYFSFYFSASRSTSSPEERQLAISNIPAFPALLIYSTAFSNISSDKATIEFERNKMDQLHDFSLGFSIIGK